MSDERPLPMAPEHVAPSHGGFGIAPYYDPALGGLVPFGDGEAPLASHGARFGARVVDATLLVVAMTPGLTLFLGNGLRGSLVWPAVAAALGALVVSVYQWARIASSGQSIGKRLFSIKVVKIDGAAIGFLDGVVVREWCVALLGLIPLVGRFVTLADALVIFGRERRCLHDYLARTKVVEARATAPR